MDWRSRAACRNAPEPELSFPLDTTGGPAARQVAAAKAICARYPVLAECRSWAISHEAYGIWGGLTEHQRAPSATAPQPFAPFAAEPVRPGREP
jgi:WhiB family redox-sensing transcriptional regulator